MDFTNYHILSKRSCDLLNCVISNGPLKQCLSTSFGSRPAYLILFYLVWRHSRPTRSQKGQFFQITFQFQYWIASSPVALVPRPFCRSPFHAQVRFLLAILTRQRSRHLRFPAAGLPNVLKFQCWIKVLGSIVKCGRGVTKKLAYNEFAWNFYKLAHPIWIREFTYDLVHLYSWYNGGHLIFWSIY